MAKILKWEYMYINMAEVLPDNLDLTRRSQSEVQRKDSCSLKTPKKKELTKDWKGLVAWSVSFSTFVVIISMKHPEKFKELLAYHTTILIEALHFGRKGWLSYDKMFWEHIDKKPESSWFMLHPVLMFLSQCVETLTCPTHVGV